MKTTVILFLLLNATSLLAQTTINGTVTDGKKMPIEGANVYLVGTYDGATTNEKGAFSFETSESGTQILQVTFLSYETFSLQIEVEKMENLNIKLREDVSTLDAVVLSAGTFEAGDNSKVSVLKPLDVVTTASALGDFVGALQTLPGTTTVAEDGRLFVRGGDAGETQIFIDGIRVFTPYTPTSNNAPTRGRYSPFLFDGITFSTGGYSAEYGQALSSVLLLNTIDEPDQEQTDVSIMSVGLGLGHTEKWKESSLSVNTSYMNLTPYFELFPSRNNFTTPYQTFSGEAVFRQKTKNGLLKLYTAFDHTNFSIIQENINYPDGLDFSLNNNNLYFNGTYAGVLGDTWSMQGGMSYTLAKNKVGVIESDIDNTENSIHAKAKFKKRFSNRFKLNFGAEYFVTNFKEDYLAESDNYKSEFNNNIEAAFTEADIIISKKFAMKLGLRGEYSELLNQATLSPRFSLAYKTGKN
ncbi:MAG: TonB-dependent receptor, partial [Leeuwenhoekiella sp.]